LLDDVRSSDPVRRKKAEELAKKDLRIGSFGNS